MGKCNEGSEINWITLTLYGSSFMRVLLKHFGYVLDDGMILVADNEMAARRWKWRSYSENHPEKTVIRKLSMRILGYAKRNQR